MLSTTRRRSQTLSEDLQNPFLTEESFSEFIALMRRIPEPRILDLGYGTDRLPTFLARLGFVVTSEDVRESFALAPPAAEEAPEQGRFPLAMVRSTAALPAAKLTLPDGAFDGVVCVTSFDALPKSHAAALVGEIQRVLRPGGFALATFAALDSRTGKPLPSPAAEGLPLAAYQNREIEQLFRSFSIRGLTVQKNGLRRILAARRRAAGNV